MTGLFAAEEYEVERAVERDPETGLYFRPGSVDLAVIQRDCRGYPRRLPPEPGDRVLDVGGHIGGATRALLAAGATSAVAVEPDPANFELLRRNVEGLPVTAIRAAAVATDRPSVPFFRGTLNGTGMGTLTGRAGRGQKGGSMIDVPAVRFGALLDDAITYVKLDCEGAEHDLVASSPFPPSVRRVIVELHVDRREWLLRLPETLAAFEEQGFAPDRDPYRPTKKAWVWTVGYKRR